MPIFVKQQHLDDLTARAQRAETAADDARRRAEALYEDLGREGQAHNATKAQARAAAEARATEIENLSLRVAALERDLAAARDSATALHAQVDELQKLNAALNQSRKDEMAARRKDVEGHGRHRAELENELTRRGAQVSELARARDVLKESADSAIAEAERTRKANATADERVRELEAKLAALADASAKELEAAKIETVEYLEKALASDRENTTLRARVEALEEQMRRQAAAFESTKETVQAAHAAEVRKLRAELAGHTAARP